MESLLTHFKALTSEQQEEFMKLIQVSPIYPTMTSTSTLPTYSLTVGNGGENHVGMEFIGSTRKKGEGWNLKKLRYARGILEDIFNLEVENGSGWQ